MPWMDQECATDVMFRSVVVAFTGFAYAGAGAAWRLQAGSFAGDFSTSKAFGVPYNELLPMYQGGSAANRRCVWWMLAPSTSQAWWGARITIPATATKFPDSLIAGSDVAPKPFPAGGGDYWRDWISHPSTQLCSRLAERTAVSNAGSHLDLACRDEAGRPVSIGTKYLAIFALDAKGTKDVPRWAQLTLAVAPPPPRQAAPGTGRDTPKSSCFAVAAMAGLVYNPSSPMYANSDPSNKTCLWWMGDASFKKPADKPFYSGVYITLPSSMKDKFPLMLFMVSDVAPPAFTTVADAASWGSWWSDPSTRTCAVMTQAMALDPANKGKTMPLPLREEGSQTVFWSTARYMVGFAFDGQGSKDVPRWGSGTRGATLLLPCRDSASQTTFRSSAKYMVGFAIDAGGTKNVPRWGPTSWALGSS
ncbi:hypothetical protein ABPG75_005980 [Micractinium tetrahymenae]